MTIRDKKCANFVYIVNNNQSNTDCASPCDIFLCVCYHYKYTLVLDLVEVLGPTVQAYQYENSFTKPFVFLI